MEMNVEFYLKMFWDLKYLGRAWNIPEVNGELLTV
jgi:hypothetical protein